MTSHPPDHYGWTAIPRSLSKFLSKAIASNTKPYSVSEDALPSTHIAVKKLNYAQRHLPTPTLNHSIRVFYYGLALLNSHELYGIDSNSIPPSVVETFFLACLLHDIGTVPETMKSTRLSFELCGAIKALELLKSFEASEDQAELVAEVINRHQDLGEIGEAPLVLGLVYFATIFDNVGLYAEFISKDTIQNVTSQYPRLGWTGCFAGTIRQETGMKPWSHTTVIENFAEQVEGNDVMKPYD